ncbi:hypothetical protein J4470_02750 [Candidatus Woesearchaeota archaeon]|nr:hypothetical protein [Candidatus Woesearchaeota archaeon]
MHLVVKTQVAAAVKEINKKKGYRVKNIDSGFIPELNNRVFKLVEESVDRANSNNRRTLMDKDV